MKDIAIRVSDVSKIYKLYNKPSDRLKESLKLTRKKCYREHYALNHINMDIHRGETVGIIGTNGSGKSTILKIITGVLNQTSGKVEVNGRISALLELGAGFNMEYTGIENVYLNGSMIGFSKEEIDQKLAGILEFADIGDFVHQPVKTYSSGMFVRLAFAVAINIDPEILIVDEALSVGDVFFQTKCYKKFEEFKELGKTILFVSHDFGSIAKYCDRVILLNKGEKLGEGDPKEMIDLYKKVMVNQLDSPLSNDPGKTQPAENSIHDGKEWKQSLNLNPNMMEYGNGLAHILDFAIVDAGGMITNSIVKGQKFTVKVKVQFEEKIQDPIVAFTIKDLQGTEITGTNTMLERVSADNPEAGDIWTVSFTQEMNLQSREYLLSLGCTGFHDGNFTVFDRQYDVCNITVISDKDSVGFYDMNSEVTIQKSR